VPPTSPSPRPVLIAFAVLFVVGLLAAGGLTGSVQAGDTGPGAHVAGRP
jgi:hypothetical protein